MNTISAYYDEAWRRGRDCAEWAAGRRVATAESCTGGLLGGILTAVPGSSAWYVGGVVAYANEVKVRELGVPEAVLEQYGAVSRETAVAMADGIRRRWAVDVALATTGIAGPGGGTAEKPVGLVWMAVATPAGVEAWSDIFKGRRDDIRLQAVASVLKVAAHL